MDSLRDSLAYWSSILGTALGLWGLIESSPWLTFAGTFLILAAGVAFSYARSQRRRLRLATIKIEGRSIDALNLASLGRRLNTSLVVQEADQVATIKGEDIVLRWRYSGYCGAPRETAVEFSIDTETNIPFERLQCFAHDLRQDPKRMHRIRPALVGPDGLSKKIAVPLLEPLSMGDHFSVVLFCKLPGCMRSGGVDYYASTMSVAQHRVPKSAVTLVFPRDRPDWVRVYECDPSGTVRLLRELRPSCEGVLPVQYLDLATEVSPQSSRIYLFQRS